MGNNSPHFKVTATKTGQFTILATLDYAVQYGVYDFKTYNEEDSFTVIITN